MPLTDAAIRNAKPGAKPVKLSDGAGLFLLITTKDQRWWRLRYRFDGKEKMLSLGTYPTVTLKDARQKRDEARALISKGIDPSAQRQAEKTADAGGDRFAAVAEEWFKKFSPRWVPGYRLKIRAWLDKDLIPYLGFLPINAITAPELLAVARRVEARGALHTAHRIIRAAGQIFRYAIATGRATRDPSGDLRGALPPADASHFASVTDPTRVAELLRMLDGYTGTPTVRAALRLAPLVFVRPGELRKAEWEAIDLDAAQWRYTVTKTRTEHIVPLSTQSVEILRELHPLTGHGRYVFPSARGDDRPMSENAVLAAMRRLGIPKDEMSGHGFRAMARTILDEVLGYRPDLIEHQLAHAVRDPNGRAYNRTAHLAARTTMMQGWADYLDGIKIEGSNVVGIRRAGNR
ncbi:integrase arm-type DNA-binding domain-containing protein [Thiocapsa sp.]|uniref:tyrosine-type recombinase/integrase n=1 Tax=Thiocapsa sp. TaxID=2024551 RepID=UPI001BCFF431|nr:integrase arm-type DNA-binding domain-containing protein [Thiocapsa sp.]